MEKKQIKEKRGFKIDCCWVAIALSLVVVVVVGLFLGYTVKINHQQIKLEANEQNHRLRIKELEKKNGKEQHEIDELKKEIEELKKKLGN